MGLGLDLTVGLGELSVSLLVLELQSHPHLHWHRPPTHTRPRPSRHPPHPCVATMHRHVSAALEIDAALYMMAKASHHPRHDRRCHPQQAPTSPHPSDRLTHNDSELRASFRSDGYGRHRGMDQTRRTLLPTHRPMPMDRWIRRQRSRVRVSAHPASRCYSVWSCTEMHQDMDVWC